MMAATFYMERFLKKSSMNLKGRVLDLGCGDGRFSRRLARDVDSVIGVDIVEYPLWQDPCPPNLIFRTGNAEKLDFPNDSFDCVLAMNMLHHAERPEIVMAEIRRVCRPEGRIIVVEPNRYNPLGYVHLTLMGGHQHFTNKQFHDLMGNAFGEWTLTQFECHCYPFPLPLIWICEVIEDILEKSKIWRPFLFYNVAQFDENADPVVVRKSVAS